jgi:hypothetical protein
MDARARAGSGRARRSAVRRVALGLGGLHFWLRTRVGSGGPYLRSGSKVLQHRSNESCGEPGNGVAVEIWLVAFARTGKPKRGHNTDLRRDASAQSIMSGH